MSRVFNFGAGPAALPLSVLEKAQAELLDYAGSGMSVMELSHRGKTYQAVIDAALANVRKIMEVPETHEVLFLQGGASMQFAMVAQNLLVANAHADYIHSGAWAIKAINEAKIVGKVNVIWNGEKNNFLTLPQMNEIKETPNAVYVHITSNETIGGVQFNEFPKTSAPLVADMSSDIMSRKINVRDFGVIYAGAQKNIGPSGLALVIIRRDLLARCPANVNIFYRYKTHADEGSMYNTPNTWGIYIVKLITEWIDELGGLAALEKINNEKAQLLYDCIDSSDFWRPCADKIARSKMNVTWRLPSEELEEKFIKAAEKAGLSALKGHRSVGGIRASIYNACPREGVVALTQFMRDFVKQNG